MSTPVEQALCWVAGLEDVGVRATHDPRKVVPPCVLIAPPRVSLDSECGGLGSWTAYAVGSTRSGNSDAWTQLDLLVARALQVLPVQEVAPGEWRGDQESGLPAFVLTWDEQVDWS